MIRTWTPPTIYFCGVAVSGENKRTTERHLTTPMYTEQRAMLTHSQRISAFFFRRDGKVAICSLCCASWALKCGLACAQAGEWAEVEEVMRTMRDAGVQPSTRSWNCLLRARFKFWFFMFVSLAKFRLQPKFVPGRVHSWGVSSLSRFF